MHTAKGQKVQKNTELLRFVYKKNLNNAIIKRTDIGQVELINVKASTGER